MPAWRQTDLWPWSCSVFEVMPLFWKAIVSFSLSLSNYWGGKMKQNWLSGFFFTLPQNQRKTHKNNTSKWNKIKAQFFANGSDRLQNSVALMLRNSSLFFPLLNGKLVIQPWVLVTQWLKGECHQFQSPCSPTLSPRDSRDSGPHDSYNPEPVCSPFKKC